jgi:hypothetical protein
MFVNVYITDFIYKNKKVLVSDYSMRMCSFLQKSEEHLKRCGGTPAAENWSNRIDYGSL